MTARVLVAGALAVAASPGFASADRYEASIAVQPQAGTGWVSEDGAAAERVLGAGVSLHATYGVRDWLALDAELGALALGQASYQDVMVSIGGAPAQPETITRTTRTGRLVAGGTLRLGVAWIPTVALGVGVQSTLRGDANVVGSNLVPDGREAGVSIRPLVRVRAGIDRRLSAHWLVGVNVGAAHDGAIGTVEAGVALARYWYPAW